MKKLVLRLFCALVALILSSGALSVLSASSASAGTPDTTTGTPVTSPVTYDTPAVSGASEAVIGTPVASSSVKITHNLVTYIQANGMKKSQKAKHAKPHKPKSITITKAMTLYTSYYSPYYHRVVWHWKWYPAGKKFTLGKDGKYHDPICFNQVKVPLPHHKPPKKHKPAKHLIYVKSISVVYTATASSMAEVTVPAHAISSCTTANSYAYAEASAYGHAIASASVTLTDKSVAKLRARLKTAVETAVKKKAASESFVDSAKLDAQTQVSASALAWASTNCTTTTAPPPTLVEITTVNDVPVGNNRTLSVSGTVASGHTAVLFCAAKNGGTITSGKQQTVAGSFTATIGYKASSEVPTANGDIAAGHDRVDCTLTQDDDQSASISSNQFEIRQLPPDPA